ncbi:MAG: alpha/beta fold hydrolase [Solirubrobacteraceae bacterium]
MSPRPLVLVPGACLGGWAWRGVAGRLRALGHDVYPVTLTGLGERVHLADRSVDLDTHIADALGVLDFEGLRDAVLVGHSYAGLVVCGVADRRPQRLDAVVYLDCSPLPDGMAISDVQTPEQREMQRSAVDLDGDGWRWPVPDRATLETGRFGSTAGLTDEHFAAIAQRGTPQPYATFTSPLRLEHERPPGVRRCAIFCTAGGITVAALRDLLARRDPRAAPFADPDWDLRELATGHWAMFSVPDQVADTLHDITR